MFWFLIIFFLVLVLAAGGTSGSGPFHGRPGGGPDE